MYAGRFNNSFINYSCVGLADITHFAIDWLMMYYILSAVAESSSSAAQGWHGIHCRGKRSGTLIECGADWSPHCLCSPPHPTFRFHLPPPPYTHTFSPFPHYPLSWLPTFPRLPYRSHFNQSWRLPSWWYYTVRSLKPNLSTLSRLILTLHTDYIFVCLRLMQGKLNRRPMCNTL